MKKMNLLAVMALFSLGSVNVRSSSADSNAVVDSNAVNAALVDSNAVSVHSDAVRMAKVASILATALASPQTYEFGYGDNKTASVTLDLLKTSFNSFSQAVHSAIHTAEKTMNSVLGQQAQFLAPGNTPLDVVNYIGFLVFAKTNPALKDGDLCFYVSKIASSPATPDEVAKAAEAAKAAAEGIQAEPIAVKVDYTQGQPIQAVGETTGEVAEPAAVGGIQASSQAEEVVGSTQGQSIESVGVAVSNTIGEVPVNLGQGQTT